MKFCPDCKAMMLPKKDAKKQAYWNCGSCGYEDKKAEVDAKISARLAEKEAITVVDESLEEDALPQCEAECEKCGNLSAFWWTVQTRASDEPETKFLKCTQCKHQWRDYQ